MLQTTITRMLGIKYPIIGGTMMSISDADFVAAISNAGGKKHKTHKRERQNNIKLA